MTSQSVFSNLNAVRLLQALELFAQTFGEPSTEVDLQATLGALVAVMDLKDRHLNVLVDQVANYYQQTQSCKDAVDVKNYQVSATTIHQAKARLTNAEERLSLLIRTYLQRVSAKLSAVEFVELVKAAIALLDHDQPTQHLSPPENKHLLYNALRSFGTQLSQPIPTFGQTIPKQIDNLIPRLARHQNLMATDGLKATLMSLVTQTLKNKAQQLTSSVIRTALKNSKITITPVLDTQDSLEDLTMVLRFESQLQAPTITQSEQAIAEQMELVITAFKTQYQPPDLLTQSQWDSELSISSPFFNPDTFATARKDFTWMPENNPGKNLKDATNS